MDIAFIEFKFRWCLIKGFCIRTIDKEEHKFGEIKDELLYTTRLTGLTIFIDGSYAKTFNQTPSKLKLYEGYIHSSGLEYLAPFGENYIKR